MLVAKNISKNYGSSEILKDVSLTLNQGEVTVILGASGCGKTTLLRSLCLLEKPNSGTLQIDDDIIKFPINKFDTSKIYPKVNIVFQQFFLWQHLSNFENIAFPMRENGFTNSEISETIKNLSNELDLETFINKYANQSSVGQKQRIAIARTLALKPKILLLDEITSALDIVQTNSIIRIIKALAEKQKIAILFVTHNLDVAKRLADNVIFMDKGIIIEQGSRSIIENPQTIRFKQFLQ